MISAPPSSSSVRSVCRTIRPIPRRSAARLIASTAIFVMRIAEALFRQLRRNRYEEQRESVERSMGNHVRPRASRTRIHRAQNDAAYGQRQAEREKHHRRERRLSVRQSEQNRADNRARPKTPPFAHCVKQEDAEDEFFPYGSNDHREDREEDFLPAAHVREDLNRELRRLKVQRGAEQTSQRRHQYEHEHDRARSEE